MFNPIKAGKDSMKGVETRSSYKIKLTLRDKKVLSIAITMLLLVVALVLLMQMSIRKTQFQSCESIVVQGYRNSCFANLANSTKNITMCAMISSRNLSNSCDLNIAYATQNALLCNYINSTLPIHDKCIYNIAVNKSNSTMCMSLSSPYKSECLYSLAKQGNFTNVSLCNLIQNTTLFQKCKTSYYYNTALRFKSYKYCKFLPNYTNTSEMLSLINKNLSNSSLIEVGLEISEYNITPQEYCYLKLANETRNISLCNFTHGIAYYMCNGILNYTKPTLKNETLNETMVCGSLNSSLKTICEYSYTTGLALSQNNVSECLSISNQTFAEDCIYNLASRYNDSSYCKYMANKTAMAACYQFVK
ncbi:MAG: hypothetical protein ACP5TL_02060 [Candidatus Micrarchaeia archaeon]